MLLGLHNTLRRVFHFPNMHKSNTDYGVEDGVPETPSSATLSQQSQLATILQQSQLPETQEFLDLVSDSFIPRDRKLGKDKAGSTSPSEAAWDIDQKRMSQAARTYVDQSTFDETLTSTPAPTPTSKVNPEPRKSKIAGYKDRKELARRIRLDASDGFAIRERREFIKVQCMRRGQILNKPFENWDTTVMYKLIRTVNPEMQTQFGAWWSFDLTRDLIHAICLDRVRNNNARSRAHNNRAPEKKSSDVPNPKMRKRSRPTVAYSFEEESENNRRRRLLGLQS